MATTTLRPRTTLHGVVQQVEEFTDLPSKGNMASECMVENLLSKHIYDAAQKKWLPMEYVAFYYDVEEHGGGIGWHGIDVTVPAGTIIIGGAIFVADTFASTGAPSVKIKVQSDVLATGDIKDSWNPAAATINDVVATTCVYTAATSILVTTDKEIKVGIGTASLQSGRCYGYLHCFRNVIGGENSSSSSSSTSESSVSTSSSSSKSSQSSSSSSTSSSQSRSSSTNSSSSSSTSSSSSSSSLSESSPSSSRSTSLSSISTSSLSASSQSSSSSSSVSASSSSSSSVSASSQSSSSSSSSG